MMVIVIVMMMVNGNVLFTIYYNVNGKQKENWSKNIHVQITTIIVYAVWLSVVI